MIKTVSTWRRPTRRGALALLLGTVAVFGLERRAVFAVEASSSEDVASAAASDEGGNPDGGDAPATADAPAADSGGSGSSSTASTDSSAAAAAPASTAPVTLKSYTVQTGDTMFSIAKKHGVSVDAVLWANNLTDANVIKVGQQLTIPPATGKLYVAKDGDTLDNLATSFSVSKAGIAAVNGLAEDATLKAGQRLLIPVTTKTDPALPPSQLAAASSSDPVPIDPNGASGSPTPPSASTLTSMMQTPSVLASTGTPTVTVTNKKVPKLAWPIALNPPKVGVSTPFILGRPGVRAHTGIDIYAPTGTPIGAAAAGTVKMAQKNPAGFTGYGWIVILDHGDGISTWYAHCSGFSVSEGDKVKAGDTIGKVGTTGEVTGPHVHFELRIGTTPVDPRLALP
jgi:murein DD-endopeptidase MepM/ murein hydrolase activator NlpD